MQPSNLSLAPEKKTESLIMAYDVLDSFGKKYQYVAFKDHGLPEMDQWAFFMFMIGQRAKIKYVHSRLISDEF